MSNTQGIAMALGLLSLYFIRPKKWRSMTLPYQARWALPDKPKLATSTTLFLTFIGAKTGPVLVTVTDREPEEYCRELASGPGRFADLKVWYAFEVSDPHQAIGSTHNALAEHCVNGEWYERKHALAFASLLAAEIDK